MITTPQQLTANGAQRRIQLKVRDVTGTHHAEMELDPALRVGTVAETVAARMSLPADTAWALRAETTAAYLDDEATIGEAVETNGRTEVSLVATPRAHLG